MSGTLRDSYPRQASRNLQDALLVQVNILANSIPRAAILAMLVVLVAVEVYLVSNLKLGTGLAVAAVPFLAIGALFLIYHFEYSPIIILLTAAFVPFYLPTGTGSPLVASLMLSIGLVAMWVLKMMAADKRIVLKPSLFNLPALGFMVVTVVSLVWSNIFRDPIVYVPPTFILVQVASAAVMIVSPAVALLAGNLVERERLLKAMVGIMLVVGVIGLAENFFNLNLDTVIGGLTSLWVVALATSLALFNKNIRKPWKVFLLVLTLAWFVWNLVLNINWYAGWLPGLVAVGVIAFIRSKRLFLGLLVVLVAYTIINYNAISANVVFKQSNDGDTRLAAWNVNWAVTSQHLLLGTGPAGYAVYYMTLTPNTAMATHNNYIDIISETGVVGTVFYLWLFGTLVWLGWKVVRRLRYTGNFREALAIGLFAGVIGCIVIMAFGDWLLPFAYTQTIAGFNYTVYSWLFIGALLALEQMTAATPQ